MKRTIVKDLNQGTRLLSFGNNLHVLQGGEPQGNGFSRWTVKGTQTFENPIRYDLSSDRKLLFQIDEASKGLKVHQVEQIMQAGASQPVAQTWLKKKLTDVAAANAVTSTMNVTGVLISDRVGEVKFISVDKLLQDGLKPTPDPNGNDQEEREDEVPKTLFGQ